ncbi:hypothetical protein AB1L88_15615 [Tautonia sp. JC769]|uniref:hypothetical protein n=1 Tax=Tautonia sp. JC769 TaxID=3232135 RepID=UPI00345A85A6
MPGYGKPKVDWRTVQGPDGRNSQWWLGQTGYHVRHCGHPTALWPYTSHTPDGRTLSNDGQKRLGSLRENQRFLEDLCREETGSVPMIHPPTPLFDLVNDSIGEQ